MSQSSYRKILKTTSLFGGVQVFQILITIIKSKFETRIDLALYEYCIHCLVGNHCHNITMHNLSNSYIGIFRPCTFSE